MVTATLPQDDTGATLTRFDHIRGDRYAEIFLVGGDPAAELVAAIQHTQGRNSPTGTGDTGPQALLERLDLDALAREHGALPAVLNGPRLWCLDRIDVMVGAERDFQGLRARARPIRARALESPRSWRFRSVVLDENLVLTPHDGLARITQDELGNTDDRVGGPFSNVVP